MIPRILLLCLALIASAAAQTTESVLIRTPKPYAGLVSAIEKGGGRVTHQYKYVDAIAAKIPRASLAAINAMVAPGAISKDLLVPAPASVDTASGRPGLARSGEENRIEAESVETLGAVELAAIANATPNAYLLNNSINGTAALHAAGTTGAGVIVAVIDSGIRPGFLHISLDGSVIGGEDFVGDGLGYSNSANDGHGTFVAGMISANVAFVYSTTSTFRNAVLAECPSCFSDPPTNTTIPMIGTAPLASIYAVRVFAPTGGTPTSRVLAAMEHVISLREQYDAGIAGGLNISICNMSLGGSTVFAARDLFDTAIDVMRPKTSFPLFLPATPGPRR